MPIGNSHRERFQLLSTFKAIYDCGGISAAANQLDMTQSAVSKQLKKLRDWFDDELFVRTAKGMEPTTKAFDLIENVERVLFEVEGLASRLAFKPQTLSGEFTVATTSEIYQRLSSSVLAVLKTQAPGLRVTFVNLKEDYALRELETGKVNLVISVNWHAPETLIQKRLFSDKFVVVLNKKNPLSNKKLTLSRYVNSSHILVAPLGFKRGYIDQFLLNQGLSRRVSLSVPDFSILSTDVIDDEHIITLPERVASKLVEEMELLIKPLPFIVPSFNYYSFWHKRYSKDQSHSWMRGIIASLLSE